VFVFFLFDEDDARVSFVNRSGSLQSNRAPPRRIRAPRRASFANRPTPTLETLTRGGLLQLLLDAELVRVPALLLAAVHGARVEAGVAPGGAEEEKRARSATSAFPNKTSRFETCDSPE
jgi:hypothetical protein